MCRSKIIQYTTCLSSYHTITYNKVTLASSLRSGHGIHSACRLRHVASIPLLVLVGSLNWRAYRCPRKVGAVFPKVALLATVIAYTVTLHAWAGAPQVGTSINITLYPALLRGKVPRPPQSGLPSHNCCICSNPPCVGRSSSGGDLHKYNTVPDPVEGKSS